MVVNPPPEIHVGAIRILLYTYITSTWTLELSMIMSQIAHVETLPIGNDVSTGLPHLLGGGMCFLRRQRQIIYSCLQQTLPTTSAWFCHWRGIGPLKVTHTVTGLICSMSCQVHGPAHILDAYYIYLTSSSSKWAERLLSTRARPICLIGRSSKRFRTFPFFNSPGVFCGSY